MHATRAGAAAADAVAADAVAADADKGAADAGHARAATARFPTQKRVAVRFSPDAESHDGGENARPAAAAPPTTLARPAAAAQPTALARPAALTPQATAAGPAGPAESAAAQAAEAALLKRLRMRSLSTAEARAALAEHRLSDEQIEGILQTFQRCGYLDDRALAEQLVHVGVDRKGQGRRAIAQALTARGIPRAEAEQVLAELPDDDAERALDYARRKVRAVAGSGREAALRRLVGQLQRRGYSSSVAMTAARAALDGEP